LAHGPRYSPLPIGNLAAPYGRPGCFLPGGSIKADFMRDTEFYTAHILGE
jgi:hypothetical protein